MTQKTRKKNTYQDQREKKDCFCNKDPMNFKCQGRCQVCGETARIINYGALSCASCKTFFRRHGFRPITNLKCLFSMHCSITAETRKSCTACRYEKCLAVGMSPELIRKEDLSHPYRLSKDSRIVKHNRAIARPCLHDLIPVNPAPLSTSNWRLLTNVVHAFDTYDSVLSTRNFIARSYLPSISFEQDLIHSRQIFTSIYTGLRSFIHSTADFRIMTTGEQLSLFQRNMFGLLAFYCLFVYRESGMFANSINEQALIPLFGSENIHSTKLISTRLDSDITLIKLLIITLLFSSNCYTVMEEDRPPRDYLLQGTFRLFGSQNVYAILLWNYMIYRYGFRETVRRFAAMIKVTLDTLRLASFTYDSNELYQNLAHQLAEQSERSLTLSDDENPPLWGKSK